MNECVAADSYYPISEKVNQPTADNVMFAYRIPKKMIRTRKNKSENNC